MSLPSLEVVAYRSVASAAPLAAELNALNAVSRRPCPFSTFEFLSIWEGQRGEGEELLLLVALREGRVAGYFPLVKARRTLLAVPHRRIETLTHGYRDRPHVLAAAADEKACAAAFYRFLVEVERGWSELVLHAQDADSALNDVPAFGAHRFYVRRFENAPNLTIRSRERELAGYYRALEGTFRRKATGRMRKLLAAGSVEVVACADPAAAARLLPLYIDVERRSWKGPAAATMADEAGKRAFVESLCRGGQPATPVFDFIMLEGTPVAGFLSFDYRGCAYGIETAYDASFAELSPGYLLHLMCIRHLMSRGVAGWNLLHSYSYYKVDWGGEMTPASAIEIFRTGSLPHLKARLGGLKRALSSAAPGLQFNPARRDAERGGRPATVSSREQATAQASSVLADVVQSGARIERLAGPSLRAALPFEPVAKKSGVPG